MQRIIHDFDLFKCDENHFWSESVLRRIGIRIDKSEKRTLAAHKRWNKSGNSNALQMDSKSNAIKKRTEQETKETLLVDFRGEQISDLNQHPVEQGEDVEARCTAPDPQFEKCWKLYEGHGVKKKALEYWRRLKPEQRNTIEAKIPSYVASTSGPRKQYRKMFQGWINPANELWTQPIMTVDASPKMKNGQWVDETGMRRIVVQ